MIKQLILMCLEDDDIMEYVFFSPAPTAQNARYTDWLIKYARDLLSQM